MTQAHPEKLILPVMDQSHAPLAFLGAAFKGAEGRWSTYEKEDFAIFKVLVKLDYLLLGSNPMHVFTDHTNLLYVFSSLALEPSLSRHIVTKYQRWALYLSRFHYVIEHTDGNSNVFADIITRWLKGYRQNKKSLRKLTLISEAVQIIDPPNSDEFIWPSCQLITAAQRSISPTDQSITKYVTGILRLNGRIWIPETANELKLMLIVASHCGQMGHRGK